MPDGLLSRKNDFRLVILAALILLDAFTFVIFDVLTGVHISTLGDAGWIFNAGHVMDLLSGRYSIDFILGGLGAFYTANSFIINKIGVILVSGLVVAAIYRYAPDLLFICYGYLLGVAGVGIYEGLLNTGMISAQEMAVLPFDQTVIPRALMAICVVLGGIISFSKVAAYIFSQIIALRLFGDDKNYPDLNIPVLGSLLKRATVSTSEDHRLRIPGEYLPVYEKNIRELADLDTQNSIEAIQRSYDLVNQMAEKYGIDQYHIMYDVYKEKQGRGFMADRAAPVSGSVFNKGS